MIVPLLLFAGVLTLLVLLLWWLLIRTEGVYLGKRVVIWLYDVYASRYDDIVEHDIEDEHLYIAAPSSKNLSRTRIPSCWMLPPAQDASR